MATNKDIPNHFHNNWIRVAALNDKQLNQVKRSLKESFLGIDTTMRGVLSVTGAEYR